MPQSVLFAAVAALATAELRFATSYGSHMVLQQAPAQAKIWGVCSQGASVSLAVDVSGGASKTYDATCSSDGTWTVVLDATHGGNTPHSLTVSAEGESASLNDVLFGDVWLCSGQSNMAFLLEMSMGGAELVQEAELWPQVRLFTSSKDNRGAPQTEQPQVEQPWAVGSNVSVSQNAKQLSAMAGDDNWLYMSAVCWIFGREMARSTGLPVGLVNTNWGGTPVEFWMSADARSECPPSSVASGGAYNGMIVPLLNMTIYGAIWYQGESNQGDAIDVVGEDGRPLAHYACTFPAMIRDWRAKWHASTGGLTSLDFPFGFVQLAAYDQGGNPAAANIRWAQRQTLSVPKTFMAVTNDLGDHTSPYGSVHIRDKLSVGLRLALGSRAVAYGDTSVYWTGPVATKATVSDAGLTVELESVGTAGIEVRNSVGWELCVLGAAPNGECSVYTAEGWTAASVSQHGPSSVTLSTAGSGAAAQAVRYAWADFACEYKNCSVYSAAEDLPMGPFVLYANASAALV